MSSSKKKSAAKQRRQQNKAMSCPFCRPEDRKPLWERLPDSHLVVTDAEGRYHVHGNKNSAPRLIEMAQVEYGLVSPPAQLLDTKADRPMKETLDREAVVFLNDKQRLGDILAMTAGVRDFALMFPNVRLGVKTGSAHIWDNNPYVDPGFQEESAFVNIGLKWLTNKSNQVNWHMVNSFRLSMEMELGVRIEPGFTRPDVWMSREEIEREPIVDGPYWIITTGGEPGWPAKMYPMDRWQYVVDQLKDKIQFVQLQLKGDPLPKLKNVVDLVGKTEDPETGIRDLVNVFYNSQGSVGLVSMHMHMSAAFDNACVVVAGAREPAWFTQYIGHRYLDTLGLLPCSVNHEKEKDSYFQVGCWKTSLESCLERQENSGMNPVLHGEDGKTPPCVEILPPERVVEAIEFYYSRPYPRLKYGEKVANRFFKNITGEEKTVVYVRKQPEERTVVYLTGRELNLLASLNSKGGGEQSALKIAQVLIEADCKVNFYPWDKVHEQYQYVPGEFLHSIDTYKNGRMMKSMKPGLPLLFYANDQIFDFVKNPETLELFEKSSSVAIAINWMNGQLPKAQHLADTGKLRAVIFQCEEKQGEFVRDMIKFPEPFDLEIQPGAIELEIFSSLKIRKRGRDEDLVVLKHCVGDYRKYVTERSARGGDKIHAWQRNIIKEPDTEFYKRFLSDMKGVRFEFMEAHPELKEAFKNEPRMVFHEWNSMPVPEFLSRGHVYLYRTSNMWRDNFPRVVGEALAAGLPVLTEPRDGTKDRVEHGDTGFHCIDYDGFLYGLKLLKRKEAYRYEMGQSAREWAKEYLDPRNWVNVLNELFFKEEGERDVERAENVDARLPEVAPAPCEPHMVELDHIPDRHVREERAVGEFCGD